MTKVKIQVVWVLTHLQGLINKELEKILDKIIYPTLKALKKLNSEYRGFLYAGLMIVENEPYLIEYNVRMGDPECQTIIPKLKNDLYEIILACCEKRLDEIDIQWNEKKAYVLFYVLRDILKSMKKILKLKNINKIILMSIIYVFMPELCLKKIKFLLPVEEY